MDRIKQAVAEIAAMQLKVDAGRALIEELTERSNQVLKAQGFDSPEGHMLAAAASGVGDECQRLIRLMLDIQSEAFPPCSHGGDI
jgi:hypothetical protein